MVFFFLIIILTFDIDRFNEYLMPLHPPSITIIIIISILFPPSFSSSSLSRFNVYVFIPYIEQLKKNHLRSCRPLTSIYPPRP